MKDNVEKECDIHESKYECPDYIIDYNEKFDEYWIVIHWDSFSHIVINFCPWCGKRLKSKRDLWFNELEKMGFIDPLFDKNIPKKFKNWDWYKVKIK